MQAFVRAAERAPLAAGFEGREVHAPHGYLLHFLRRCRTSVATSAGGCFENRIRLLLQVTAAVRKGSAARVASYSCAAVRHRLG